MFDFFQGINRLGDSDAKEARTNFRQRRPEKAAARMLDVISSRPLGLIQGFGLAAGVFVGLAGTLNGALSQPPDSAAMIAVRLVLLAIWCACFWRLTGEVRVATAGWPEWTLLLVEALVGFVLNAELLMIVAAQIPMVLRGQRAWRVLAGVELLIVVNGGLAAWSNHFEPSDVVRNMPVPLSQVLTVIEMMFWAGFAFGAGIIIRELELQRRQIIWTNSELLGTRQLLIDSSRANERLRISRELHDSLGHHLVSLGMNLEIAGRKCNEEAKPAIEKARLVARLLLAEVREAVAEYREERMVNLDHALRLLVSNVEDPPVECEVNLPGQISSQKAHILFRTCEEAITNIRKHARASTARLEIRQDLGRIHLLIHDNGRGVDAVEAGNGLRGIKERFAEAGGSIGWQSKPGGGFLLAGWLPAEDSIA